MDWLEERRSKASQVFFKVALCAGMFEMCYLIRQSSCFSDTWQPEHDNFPAEKNYSFMDFIFPVIFSLIEKVFFSREQIEKKAFNEQDDIFDSK